MQTIDRVNQVIGVDGTVPVAIVDNNNRYRTVAQNSGGAVDRIMRRASEAHMQTFVYGRYVYLVGC